MRLADGCLAEDDVRPLRPRGPLRPLFVSDHLGAAGGAIHGATTYFLNTLPALARRGVMPSLCILGPEHPAAERFAERGLAPIFLERGKWDPRALGDLLGVVRRQRPDILHLSGMKGALVGAAAASLAGLPAILHLHDLNRLKPGLAQLQHVASRRMRRVIVVSKAVRRLATEAYRVPAERVEVLANGLDLGPFDAVPPGTREQVRATLGLPPRAPVVGMTSRLVPEKGHASAIAAMPPLRERCPDARLLIVGDGPERSNLERHAAAHGCAEAVLFLGQRDDVPPLLAAMDVLAMPSLCEEAFGYSALEALAMALPVVAFDSEGLRDIVLDERTGLLVPKCDVQALANRLGDVLSERAFAQALGREGRRHAHGFTIERHACRLEEMYDEVTLALPRSGAKPS